jgi:AcrR family transcriptional regulator
MPRWSPDAALRLEASAILLFERQGFSATTVPQIAHAAGLTTRTFFRHFADKRDVLFLRDREFPHAVSDFMASTPPESSMTATVRAGLAAAARGIEDWRQPIAHRRKVVHSEPALHERELLQRHHLARAIEESLIQRGADPRQSHTLAAVAVTCFDLAMERWLAGPDDVLLEECVESAWNNLRDCLDG